MSPIDRDNDIDDDFDDEDYDEGGSRSWLRRLIRPAVIMLALFAGFMVPYVLYLNYQVGERFGKLQWQVPTRVFARPLLIAPGIPMDDATLGTELDAASYRPGDGVRPGTYAHDAGGWHISSRGFNDVDGRIAPVRIGLTMANRSIATLRDDAQQTPLRAARMDPARIATLYGKLQEERRLVRIDEVPELLVTGLQAVEDRDFNHHIGIDFGGMARALFKNIASGGAKREGGSTLTQQLARSGLLGIGKEQTYSRKFKEIIFALLLEARYDKRTILEAYFNQVYLGQRGNNPIHGVAAGAEYWFGKDLKDLNQQEIALLVGIVRGPSVYDPRRHPDRALERRNFALGQFKETGLITDAQYQADIASPLGVSPQPGGSPANRFPAYLDLVRRQLSQDYGEDQISGQGLSVMTGMSPSVQALTEASVTATMTALSTPGRAPLQTGSIVTDVFNGDVLAVIGSRNYTEAGFNRAVQMQRPVGSLLKPFIYMLGLSQPTQYSLATYLDDSPVTVNLGGGRTWTPKNADGRSHGQVRMIDALAQSMNQATVRLGMSITTDRIVTLLSKLAGIQAQSNPSLILGALDQSPYAMAQLYQFLASQGQVQTLHAVRGVLNANGIAIKRYDSKAPAATESDAVAAKLVTFALQEAVRNGTAQHLQADGLGGLQAAGKTGTSNDSRDSWFAGWTGSHLAVSWVGNDQNQQTGLYGATGGMRIWSGLFKRLPSAPLRISSQGVEVDYVVNANSTTPDCPAARRLVFVQGFGLPQIACPNSLPASGAPSGFGAQLGDAIRNIFGGGTDQNSDGSSKADGSQPNGSTPESQTPPSNNAPAAPPVRVPN